MLEQRVEEWRHEAVQKGRQRALRRLLTKQLTKRFGSPSADIDARIEQASLEQLGAWLDRFVDAGSLQAVFDTSNFS